ncbi:MAG: CHASE domain-containing protein [Erythrobacter sp.]
MEETADTIEQQARRSAPALNTRELFNSTQVVVVVMLIATILTGVGWHYAVQREADRNSSEFDAIARDAEQAIYHRMDTYGTALDGAAALVRSHEDTSFVEWDQYVASLDLDRSLAGMNGIGYISAVKATETQVFFDTARSRGVDIRAIHPVSNREELLPITYISPLEVNREALGLDLSFEENRHEALKSSRRTGKMTITKPITLVQDSAKGAGFLLVRPVYRPGAPNQTVEQRLAASNGWSYAPIMARMLLADLTPRQGRAFQITVRQAGAKGPAGLIYSSNTREDSQHVSQFSKQTTIAIAGQIWVVEWHSLPEFEQAASSDEPLLVLLGGVLLTLTLGALLFTLWRREAQVRLKVAEATQTLAQRDEERGQMLTDLRKARDESLAAAKAKSVFLANMSHELRTPMNGVLGFADLLMRADLPDNAHRQAEMIVRSGQAMALLLDDILDLSRIEAGKMVIAAQSIDPCEICNHVAQLVLPAAQKKGLTVECVVDKAIPKAIIGDKLRVQQVLLNLAGNAVKFTDRGFVRITLNIEGENLRFEVRDSGIGIEEALLETLFEDFVQADDSNSRLRGGSGLGLAISRKLAKAMGGTLTAASHIGSGSNFTFTIPLVEAATKPSNLSEVGSIGGGPVAGEDRSSIRVILAEDHDVNRMLVEEMAQDVEITLDCASDGQEVVAMIEHAALNDLPYHLVLMDVQMPRMDGLQATKVLREKGYDEKSLPVVALTANAFPEDVQKCLRAGMQAHCAKPLTIERFEELLGQWLTRPDGPSRKAA